MVPETETKVKYDRPKNNADALQVAIGRWVEYQVRTWKEEAEKPRVHWLQIGNTTLRIILIVLAGTITVLSDVEGVARTTITVLSGTMTILTAIDGFLKLSERGVAAENMRTEILAEYDRQGYEWMHKVELETNTDKALDAAKILLETCPPIINAIKSKYTARTEGEAPKDPR